MAETLAVPLPAPGWVEGALGAGTRVWGEERACTSDRRTRRSSWHEKYALFIFLFCQRQMGFWRGAGIASFAMATLLSEAPRSAPRPFAWG